MPRHMIRINMQVKTGHRITPLTDVVCRPINHSTALRTVLVIFFLSAAGFFSAQAQFGITGGLALSGYDIHGGDRYISGDDYRPFLGYEAGWLQHGNTWPDLGFHLGATYRKAFSMRSALQTELSVVQRGLNFVHRTQYNTAYYLNVTYLQLPVLFAHNFTSTRKIAPGIQTGPYAALQLSSNRKLEIWDDKNIDKVSGVSSWDIGWVAAFTLEWPAWSGHLSCALRMDYGLASALFQPAHHIDIYVDAGKARVIAFSLLAGYRFGP